MGVDLGGGVGLRATGWGLACRLNNVRKTLRDQKWRRVKSARFDARYTCMSVRWDRAVSYVDTWNLPAVRLPPGARDDAPIQNLNIKQRSETQSLLERRLLLSSSLQRYKNLASLSLSVSVSVSVSLSMTLLPTLLY